MIRVTRGLSLYDPVLYTTFDISSESAAGWTMLDSWHAEQTSWLRALKTETERQPDFNEGMGPPIAGLRSHDIGWESGTLLLSDEPF